MTSPTKTTDRLPATAQRVARFECRNPNGSEAGWSEVHLSEGVYVIRWQWAGRGVWERTTRHGKQALKEAANRWGWGL